MDEDNGAFERHIVSLPGVNELVNEGGEQHDERMVDFAAIIADSDEEEEGDAEMMDIEDDAPSAPTATTVVAEDVPTDGGAGAGAGVGGGDEEQEIDGVGFIVRQGTTAAPRRSIHSVIESLQAKAGRRAVGYDESDAFIDDEDLETGGGFNEGLLGVEEPQYQYGDFRMSSDWAPTERSVGRSRKRQNGGSSAKKPQKQRKPLKALKDLTPPATDELKAAIEHFREQANLLRKEMDVAAAGKRVFKLPEALNEPLLRLGRAIESWHPKNFLIKEMFQYVSDTLPPNTAQLKDKARKLLGPITPKDDLETAVGPTAVSSQQTAKEKDVSDSENANDEAVSFEAIKTRLRAKVAEQDAELHREDGNQVKPMLRFQWDDELMELMEGHRTRVQKASGSAGIKVFYAEIISLFPDGFMNSSRISSKLTQYRKKEDKRRKLDSGEATPNTTTNGDEVEEIDEDEDDNDKKAQSSGARAEDPVLIESGDDDDNNNDLSASGRKRGRGQK